MGAVFSMQFRTEDTLRQIDALKARAPQAIARALNRAIASAKTAMAREIAQDMNLPVRRVSEDIGVEEARADKHVARLSASFKRIPIAEWKPSGPSPSRGKGRGVSVNMGRGRVRYPNAFLARFRSGHVGVFTRTGSGARKSAGAWSKNLPIAELRGASIAHVFEKHVAVGIARAEEQLVKNLQSEFRFAMR